MRSSGEHDSGHDSDSRDSFIPAESDKEYNDSMSDGFVEDSESSVEKDEATAGSGGDDYFDDVAPLDEIGVYSDEDEGESEEEHRHLF